MPVTIETNGSTMTARLSGELDHHHTQKLREEIDRSVQKERPARLALDFSGVERKTGAARHAAPHPAGHAGRGHRQFGNRGGKLCMNKPKNTMKVTFPSRGANEGLARMLIAAFITEADPTVEELCDIKTAVSEAVTNCIVHAYPDRIGEIYIAAALSENDLLTVKVRDRGCGIADVQKAMEPLFTTGGSERAGLGFAVMQELMDEVRVTSRVGGGTTVRLRRRLSQKTR